MRISCFRLLFLLFTLSLITQAQAQSATLLLWPIQQVIEADRNGSALWIENRGGREARVQIRIFAWDQHDYQDSYAAQQQVLASPQVARIAPGKRQLVRLMRLAAVPGGEERAFRVIVDDIPDSATTTPEKPGKIGLKFQMRYSLPLFLDGAGVWTKPDPQRPRPADSATQPKLDWRIDGAGDRRYLLVRNRGPVHARLSQVQWQAEGAPNKVLAAGLLGYVLPGREMRWPLKSLVVDERASLKVQLADNTALVDVPHQ